MELRIRPLKIDEKIMSVENYIEYLISSHYPKKLEDFAIKEFEEKLKSSNRESFEFGSIEVTRKPGELKPSTSWKSIYDDLNNFLFQRASDSREYDMDGLEYIQGVGYCIQIDDVMSFIENSTKKNTYNYQSSASLKWPKIKKDDYLKKVIVPNRDYRIINDYNGEVIWGAKRFNKSVEELVVKPFETALQKWFEQEHGVSQNNPGAYSVKDEKQIGNYCMAIQLVRVETPQYKEIVEVISTELDDIENLIGTEQLPNLYKGAVTKAKDGLYVNIKTLQKRLSEEQLMKDNLIKVSGKYIIHA